VTDVSTDVCTQHKEDVKWFNGVARIVSKDFVAGIPLHIAQPEKSIFKVMTQEEFNLLSDKEMQDTWKKSHIVRTGLPIPGYGFDKSGMATLTYPSKVFTIQGMPVELRLSFTGY
jgi:hypothetical protein